MNLHDYRTIEKVSEGLYKEKGSKFLAYAFAVEHAEDIRKHMAAVKALHPKARHHCSAYRLGTDEITEFSGDAGEPSGSAGLPILNQIRSADVTNCLIIVVRYFGGTKLGIPGLIHAYKEAAADALAHNSIVVREIMTAYELHVPYADLEKVYREVKRLDGRIDDQQIGNTAVFHIRIPCRNQMAFEKDMQPFIIDPTGI